MQHLRFYDLNMEDLFRKFAVAVSNAVGSIWTLFLIIVLVLGTGMYFNFSPAWKSNTSFAATLSALLLLCFLQHSQNHSDKAAHLKLDELINAYEGTRDEVISVEDEPKKQMERLKKDSRR